MKRFFDRTMWKKLLVVAGLLLSVGCGALWAITSIMAGDMEITSRLMTFEKNIYVARGGLKATQKDSVLTADRGIYDRNLEIVKAIDNVVVIQPGSELKSDYLEAYVKEDRLMAKGNPRLVRIADRQQRNESGQMVNHKARLILTCNEVEGFNKENRFVAKGDVHLVEVPYRVGETDEEALENEKNPSSDLTCENLEMFSNEDKAIARNNVVIVTKTLRATGDKAIYVDKEGKLIIVGHAHAFQSSKETPTAEEQVSELYANKIIYYPNEDRTIAVGEVHATVYPKGQKGPGDDADKKKKKKKKSGEEGDAASGTAIVGDEGGKTGLDAAGPNEESTVTEKPPANLPEGNYSPVGGSTPAEPGVIEAKSEEE